MNCKCGCKEEAHAYVSINGGPRYNFECEECDFCFEFKKEDNLDYVERIAKERKLI